jgi:hypothetical protein
MTENNWFHRMELTVSNQGTKFETIS